MRDLRRDFHKRNSVCCSLHGFKFLAGFCSIVLKESALNRKRKIVGKVYLLNLSFDFDGQFFIVKISKNRYCRNLHLFNSELIKDKP